MDETSAVQIIGALTISIVTIINAMVAFKTGAKVDKATAVVAVTSEKVEALTATSDTHAGKVDEKLEVIKKSTDGNLSEVTQRLNESNVRNEALIADSNARIEQLLAATSDRVKSLEAKLEAKEQLAPPTPPGYLGGEPGVQKIEIQQPEANPVPVRLPTEKPSA